MFASTSRRNILSRKSSATNMDNEGIVWPACSRWHVTMYLLATWQRKIRRSREIYPIKNRDLPLPRSFMAFSNTAIGVACRGSYTTHPLGCPRRLMGSHSEAQMPGKQRPPWGEWPWPSCKLDSNDKIQDPLESIYNWNYWGSRAP